MPYYKLTDQNLKTHNGFQWTLGKWESADGGGELCSKHWLHCYNDPVLAVLLNPIHADIQNPRLFKIQVKGKKKFDLGLKFGFTQMRLVKEMSLPNITLDQKIAFGILCVKQAYKNKDWNKWADNWLNGKNRTARAAAGSARAARAAGAAADATKKSLNLIKLIKQALKY